VLVAAGGADVIKQLHAEVILFAGRVASGPGIERDLFPKFRLPEQAACSC